eukprot:scaffold73852_cov16-Tisochrysis_lutea.AAC.1
MFEAAASGVSPRFRCFAANCNAKAGWQGQSCAQAPYTTGQLFLCNQRASEHLQGGSQIKVVAFKVITDALVLDAKGKHACRPTPMWMSHPSSLCLTAPQMAQHIECNASATADKAGVSRTAASVQGPALGSKLWSQMPACRAGLRVSGLELGGLCGSLLAGKLSDYLISKSGGREGTVGKRVQGTVGDGDGEKKEQLSDCIISKSRGQEKHCGQ